MNSSSLINTSQSVSEERRGAKRSPALFCRPQHVTCTEAEAPIFSTVFVSHELPVAQRVSARCNMKINKQQKNVFGTDPL